MKSRDAVDLLLLAAIWGISFIFARVAAPAFGPVALAALRVGGAAALLVPLALASGQAGAMRRHAWPLAVSALLSSALPFLAFNYAALSLEASLLSILNATTPLFSAVIVWAWLGESLSATRVAGLGLGFAGVCWLALDRAGIGHAAGTVGTAGAGWAVLASLFATLCYALAASYTKKRLAGAPPLAIAAGTLLLATLMLAGPAWQARPAQAPGLLPWLAALGLAGLCTGVAYVLYFRLLQRVGPSNATAVTFLIPAFGVFWGHLLLDEPVTLPMLACGAVIVLGTTLATGYWQPGRSRQAQPTRPTP